MSKKNISVISILLAAIMLTASLTACDSSSDPIETDSQEGYSEKADTDISKESESEQVTETEQTSNTQADTDIETETETETELDTTPRLECENALLIENAQRLAGGIQSYYTDADRTSYRIENKNMSLDYLLTGSADQMVTSIKNTYGKSYLENTMDVFVRMKDGQTYYASASDDQTRVNIYRFGYYYYDIHMLEQDFEKPFTVLKETNIPITSFKEYKHTTRPEFNNGELSVTITNQEDPQVFAATNFPASEYNNLQITVKSNSVVTIPVYIIAGAQTHHNNSQTTTIEIINDGEWHTYNIPLNEETFPDYTGSVRSIRLDLGGIIGKDFHLKGVKIQNVKYDDIPLSLDRTFHAFPDKLHQELHVVAYEDCSEIDAIGMITEISADTVSKIIVKDKSGLRYSLDSVDWASAEYVGFDIKGVGIFGYILPHDGESGTITVVLKNGNYMITQTHCPENGTILAPISDTSNDFRMGHRLYTDSTHSFNGFLKEAYCERNPLDERNISINTEKFSRGAKFKGYDAIRGVYTVTLKGPSTFNDPYYNFANLHYNASIEIKGDEVDRSFYVMTYTSSGILECAVLLDENNLMLPVPLEVSKNFSEKEEPFYNCGDQTYGETFFPITVKSEEQHLLTVLNIYQNWGNYPLKQVSSIGYYMPYYHLSTGVTETNCISPWYNRGKNLWTLPDHRSMSMPASSDLKNMYPAYGNQPQRPNAGYHYFLQYTDAEGNYYATDNTKNTILSYGPTYADIVMDYISDDGKIKVSYRHMEMPQVDENRTYYEITYEVLDTVNIANFKNDFSFYTMTGFQTYSKVGYLNKDNAPKINDLNSKSKPIFRELGDECPYFSMFNVPNANNYSNLSFLIYNSEFIMNGEKRDESFVIVDANYALALTLNIDGAVTLKAGDKFTINCIIMPWGGAWTLDDGTKFVRTDDINVQNVRLNTLLNPFKATEVENCESVESIFLPTVKTTNGKDATFTISGGCAIENTAEADAVNVTVRAEGFYSLTKPKVEELVNGKWQTYCLSSKNTPDKNNNAVDYDGYAVHYDGDGTFSYSFVITITDGAARTFRISAE